MAGLRKLRKLVNFGKNHGQNAIVHPFCLNFYQILTNIVIVFYIVFVSVSYEYHIEYQSWGLRPT